MTEQEEINASITRSTEKYKKRYAKTLQLQKQLKEGRAFFHEHRDIIVWNTIWILDRTYEVSYATIREGPVSSRQVEYCVAYTIKSPKDQSSDRVMRSLLGYRLKHDHNYSLCFIAPANADEDMILDLSQMNILCDIYTGDSKFPHYIRSKVHKGHSDGYLL